MIICTVCGTKVEENLNFCPQCGANLKEKGVPEQIPVQQPSMYQAPVQQAPVQQPSMNQPPVQQAPVQQAPIQQAPIQHAPVQQAPVQQAPIQQEAIQQESIQQEFIPEIPVMTAQEPVMPEGKVKKGKNKGLMIAIICLVAVVLAVGAVATPYLMKLAKKGGGNDEKVVVENKELKNFEAAELTTLALYPDREVEKDDIKTFAKLIEERVQILGDAYEIQVEDDRIILIVEKNLLGETANERTTMVEMLISRGNIGLGKGDSVYDHVSKDIMLEPNVVEFDRADFLKDYKANMEDERYAQLEEINADTIYAVEIKAGEQVSEHLEDLVDDDEKSYKISCLHDYTDGDYSYDKEVGYFGTVFLEDPKDITKAYIVSPAASSQKNAELMKYILSQDRMEFGLVMDILDEPNWETEGKHLGENQVASMDGETITALCTPDKFTRSYNSEVDFAEYEAVVKARLDKLGIDYMFGTTGFDDKTYCVRVEPKNFAPDFFRLIFSQRSLPVRSAFDEVSIFSSIEVVEEDGKTALRLGTYKSLEEIQSEYEIDNNTLYLIANDVTIASADVTKLVEQDGKYYLDFEEFLCFGGAEIGESEKKVLELVCAVYEESYISFDGTYEFRADGDDTKKTIDDFDWKYSSITATDEVVMTKIRDKGYEVSKEVEERNMLVITLDIPVDENLHTEFIKAMKEIYEDCNFDDGSYNKIVFVIKDEMKESPANKFRFEAEKDTYNGKMIIDEEISGPKFFMDYWSDVYEIMEEDAFFTERSWF